MIYLAKITKKEIEKINTRLRTLKSVLDPINSNQKIWGDTKRKIIIEYFELRRKLKPLKRKYKYQLEGNK